MRRWGKFYYRGKYTELALVRKLRKMGFWVSRLPRSGKGYGFDVIAVKNGRAVFFEVKRRKYPIMYIDRKAIEACLEKLRISGAKGYLVLYNSETKEWLIREINKPDAITDKYYRYDPTPVWKPFEEFINSIF